MIVHETDDDSDGTANATAVDAVVLRIRQDIVSGKLGPGQKLRLLDLRNTYGAGVGTLREALLRLEGESLVESISRRGFRVASASVSDLVDIFENLKLIEVEALRRSVTTGDDQWEAELLAAHHRMTRLEKRTAKGEDDLSTEWEQHHIAFHQALIAACGSPLMLNFCNNLRQLALRYRKLLDVPPVQHPILTAHHAPLLEVALDRRVDEACATLAEHFSVSVELLLNEWPESSEQESERSSKATTVTNRRRAAARADTR